MEKMKKKVVGAGARGWLPGVGRTGGGLHSPVAEGVAVVDQQHPLPAGPLGEAGGSRAVREGGCWRQEPHGDVTGGVSTRNTGIRGMSTYRFFWRRRFFCVCVDREVTRRRYIEVGFPLVLLFLMVFVYMATACFQEAFFGSV